MKKIASHTLSAACIAGLSMGMAPGAVAAGQSVATQAEKSEYIVVLKQPLTVRSAGGGWTPRRARPPHRPTPPGPSPPTRPRASR